MGPAGWLTTRTSSPQTVRTICAVLREMEGWIDECPPLEQPMRFGNKAFRSWHQRLLDVRGSRGQVVASWERGGSMRRTRAAVSPPRMAAHLWL